MCCTFGHQGSVRSLATVVVLLSVVIHNSTCKDSTQCCMLVQKNKTSVHDVMPKKYNGSCSTLNTVLNMSNDIKTYLTVSKQ